MSNIVIDRDFYKRPEVQKLNSNQKLIYNTLFFWGAESQIGIFTINLNELSLYTGLSISLIQEEFINFKRDVLEYDDVFNLAFLKKYYEYVNFKSGNPMIFAKKLLQQREKYCHHKFWREFISINQRRIREMNSDLKKNIKNKDKITLDKVIDLDCEDLPLLIANK